PRRIHSIGRAHRAERLASELEAQRRQGARLLHDTVLASLTLLAHSGVGVAPDVLRQQAAEDARLLRQLRLETTADHAADMSNAVPGTDDTPATSLDTVKHRFDRIGLDVHWHGTGRLDLDPDVLEAFLLALAESLENVRRHAGVLEAHVTITDDEATVRAMVTDSGSGFDPTDVDPARMGLKESIV
ncbi:MAG TPA: histidine kinase, partial [Terrimesophilobacter sp.]|nr:histidine kinase [Terrimesophilobacter sp.]